MRYQSITTLSAIRKAGPRKDGCARGRTGASSSPDVGGRVMRAALTFALELTIFTGCLAAIVALHALGDLVTQ